MITIVASFELKPECIDEFLSLAKECVEGSRAEEGNFDYNLYVSTTDKNKFFFVENWKDEASIELHNKTDHFRKFAKGFKPLIASRPVMELTEKVF